MWASTISPPAPSCCWGLALLIALGFEFVNGFHDTANAVATVIYTHSLPPLVAVVWSGLCNLAGVLVSSGAVAFTVVTLLPVELILQAGSGAGYAMIFALLIAAIIWNLGTWAFGLPNSSSHALIGSIIGVGLANQFLAPAGSATSGVEWGQAYGVFRALLFSPVLGFVLSALLLLAMKLVVRVPGFVPGAEGAKAPPPAIRGLLVLTCTLVSFFHGSNDGQKGMGLIMLILIGVAPDRVRAEPVDPRLRNPGFPADVAGRPGGVRVPCRRRRARHRRRPDGGGRWAEGQGGRHPGRLWRDGHDARPGRAPGADLRCDQGHPGRPDAERAQRHVSGVRRPARHGQQGGRLQRRRHGQAEGDARARSMPAPASSRPGSRSRWPSRSAWARWSAGSASW